MLSSYYSLQTMELDEIRNHRRFKLTDSVGVLCAHSATRLPAADYTFLHCRPTLKTEIQVFKPQIAANSTK